MTRRLTEFGAGRPLLDIASYARRGPADRVHLAQDEIQLLSRTVHRTPEVMVKVLTQGGRDRKAVGRHLSYLSRDGEVEIETDDGQRLSGQDVEQELLEDWDLDLEEARRTTWLRSRPGMMQPKLVHKVVFSMPAGTPPDGLLRGARSFARETFGAKHRYAMVLHTDEPHPHVHMVVKAVSEEGVRLNIRKATLREWRGEFARHLRTQGISANATDRAIRGSTRPKLSDGVYRALRRDASRRILAHEGAAARALTTASEASSREALVHTRTQVERGWLAAAEILDCQDQQDLAWYVRRFTEALPPVRTDLELSRETAKPREHRRPRYELTRRSDRSWTQSCL
jgi:Relaxase/Mobilisation nuclease domain